MRLVALLGCTYPWVQAKVQLWMLVPYNSSSIGASVTLKFGAVKQTFKNTTKYMVIIVIKEILFEVLLKIPLSY